MCHAFSTMRKSFIRRNKLQLSDYNNQVFFESTLIKKLNNKTHDDMFIEIARNAFRSIYGITVIFVTVVRIIATRLLKKCLFFKPSSSNAAAANEITPTFLQAHILTQCSRDSNNTTAVTVLDAQIKPLFFTSSGADSSDTSAHQTPHHHQNTKSPCSMHRLIVKYNNSNDASNDYDNQSSDSLPTSFILKSQTDSIFVELALLTSTNSTMAVEFSLFKCAAATLSSSSSSSSTSSVQALPQSVVELMPRIYYTGERPWSNDYLVIMEDIYQQLYEPAMGIFARSNSLSSSYTVNFTDAKRIVCAMANMHAETSLLSPIERLEFKQRYPMLLDPMKTCASPALVMTAWAKFKHTYGRTKKQLAQYEQLITLGNLFFNPINYFKFMQYMNNHGYQSLCNNKVFGENILLNRQYSGKIVLLDWSLASIAPSVLDLVPLICLNMSTSNTTSGDTTSMQSILLNEYYQSYMMKHLQRYHNSTSKSSTATASLQYRSLHDLTQDFSLMTVNALHSCLQLIRFNSAREREYGMITLERIKQTIDMNQTLSLFRQWLEQNK